MFRRFQTRPVERTPFAERVLALLRGASTVQECAEVLRRDERKWGLEHVAPALEVSVDGPLIKARGPARFAHVIGLPDDEAAWHHFVRRQYYGFLSDTHLVLCTMCFSDRYSFRATARAWGAVYAGWANRVGWRGSRRWGYCDFYGYTHLYVEGGEAWEEAAYQAIEYKTRQAGTGLRPAAGARGG